MNAPQRWSINGRFLTQVQTGVQRYAGEITRAIDARLASDEALARAMSWQLCLPTDAPDPPSFDAIEIRRSRIGRGHVWEQSVLPMMAPGGLVSFANLGPVAHGRQIVCLHDANVFLAPESYSSTFRLAYRTALPILGRCAAAVTTVSLFSRDMLDRFGVTAAAALVVGNGHEHALRWRPDASRFSAPDALKRPFVFALGSRAKHKQLDLLLGLAPALDAQGIDLVVSGTGAAIFGDAKIGTAPNVHHVGFVGDDDLAALFSQALCFAFPSRTEGFGLPLLEAMVHGAPIVSARSASMPEVCGDAALYAPVDDPAVWLDQITRLAQSPETRSDLSARGRARCKMFSWDDSAARYVDLAASLSSDAAVAASRPIRGTPRLRRTAP